MIDVLRIAHLRIAPQEGNPEVGNCEGNLYKVATFSRRQKPSLPGNLDFIRTKPDCQLV